LTKRRTTIKVELDNNHKNLSWEDAASQFLDSLKIRGLSYHTMRWHKENLLALLKTIKKIDLPTEPGVLTEKMMQNVVLEMINNGLSQTTVNHRVRSLRQFYKYLLTECIVSINPAERLERKKNKAVVIEAFTEKQLTDLLNACNKNRFVGFRDYTIILFLLDTGVRVSELVGVKISDIRINENEVIIAKGKGGKQRRVFVSIKTKGVLKNYLRIRGDIADNPYLFITSDNKQMKQRTVQERLTIYGKIAKLKGVRVSPHTFRHTFAKMYIIRGGDPFSLQALLGHSTLEMVKHYVNLWGSDLQKMHRQYSPVDQLFDR